MMREAIEQLVNRPALEESGQDLLEYALLVALIAIVAIAAITLTGENVTAIFDEIAAQLGDSL